MENKTIPEMLEDMVAIVCDRLCKYRDTVDDDCECELIRKEGNCPLNKFY